jgi:UDP-glucose 4-epimerase
VGGSGLLGSALRRRIPAPFEAQPVPWGTDAALPTLTADLDRFLAGVRADDAWTVYWAAGAGVIGTDRDALAREVSTVEGFARELAARSGHGRGAFFLASSAAVYAGSRGAPFTEATPPVPETDYARARLEQEQAVAAALSGRLRHVVGRITTLFGTGQNLRKGQGVISTMCLQLLHREPLRLTVPMDTLRDYLYADDASALIERLVAAAHDSDDLDTRLRLVCNGSPVTLAVLTGEVRAVSHRGVGVRRAIVPMGQHARDLRVRTEFPDETADVRRTPLPVAISLVHADLMRRLANGQLA